MHKFSAFEGQQKENCSKTHVEGFFFSKAKRKLYWPAGVPCNDVAWAWIKCNSAVVFFYIQQKDHYQVLTLFEANQLPE